MNAIVQFPNTSRQADLREGLRLQAAANELRELADEFPMSEMLRWSLSEFHSMLERRAEKLMGARNVS